MSLINREALYEKACDLEAQALAYVGKIANDETKIEEWRIWSAILIERTAFKHDIFDAPEVKPQREKCEYQYLVSQLEQKKGTWVLTDGYRCSLCNYKLQTTGIPDTCPKCGASMLDTMTYPQVDGITPSVI